VNHPILKAYGALATTVILWAISFPATKIAMGSFGAGELALLRFSFSTVALLAYANSRGSPLPDLQDMPRLALAGLFCVAVYQTGFNYGLMSVSSGAAAVLIDTIPLWAALLGAVLLRERVRAWGWAGLGLGFAGAALIALGESASTVGHASGPGLGRGVALLLMAAGAFAAAAVVQKPLLAKYGATVVTAWSFLFGILGLLWAVPGLLPQVEHAPRSAMLWVLFLALLPGALAYVLWSQALQRLPVAVAASGLYVVPPLTFLIAWAWLGETPGALSVAGAAVALAGVALVQLKGSPKPA
jgi:drug/metabolite transporter (DMT)-like permease